MINEKKGSILYVLEIIKTYSDENHPITYAEIISKLDRIYNISLERKAVARDIETLTEFGYDIVKKGNRGLYLGLRDLEEGELLYLIDAIYSSHSMPTKYAKDLANKLMKNYSQYEQKQFNHLEKIDDDKPDNKQLFYTIELLNEAISKKKKVEFKYNSYGLDKKLSPKEDKIYKVNPYFMVNNHGKYYLVCNYDKYNNLSNYKIDCITDIKIIDESVKKIDTLDGCQNFSIKQYMKEHIYMTHGESVTATLKFSNKKFVNDFIDWFGKNVSIEEKDGELLAKAKVNEEALIFWALQYGKNVEIISPNETREKIKNTLAEILDKYEK